MKNRRNRPFRRINSTRSHSDNFNNGNNGARVKGSLSTILEKYKTLAKDASTIGDHIGAENYLQHAEHFGRIINERNERNENFQLNINKKLESDDNAAELLEKDKSASESASESAIKESNTAEI